MRIRYSRAVPVFLCFILLFASGPSQAASPEISGTIKNGYRILKVRTDGKPLRFTVYRGDYIKFDLPAALGTSKIVFPPATKETVITSDIDTAPYFKMKHTGKVAFQIGALDGLIHVIEYKESHYQAMSAREAVLFIRDHKPLLLDVRTPKEYKWAHIEGAMLLPVQNLKANMKQLAPYKNRPVLIYCATGNRSTVASKILVDAGFKQIINLRHGIKDWIKRGRPVVR